MLRVMLSVVVVNLLLVAPLWFRGDDPVGRWIAIEALLLAGVFALLPRRRWSVLSAGVAALAVVLVAALGFGDSAARESLARPLNLYLDIHLLDAVRNLVGGTVGAWAGVLFLPALGVLALGSAVLLSLLLVPPGATPWSGFRSPGPLIPAGALQRPSPPPGRRGGAGSWRGSWPSRPRRSSLTPATSFPAVRLGERGRGGTIHAS